MGPQLGSEFQECLSEISVLFSQWIVMPINDLFTADRQSAVVHTASTSESSALSSHMFSLYFLFSSVCTFFLGDTFLDGCNPLIKFMKAVLSTLLKGCRPPTMYCKTGLSSCGWETEEMEPLRCDVNAIWVVTLDLFWLAVVVGFLKALKG